MLLKSTFKIIRLHFFHIWAEYYKNSLLTSTGFVYHTSSGTKINVDDRPTFFILTIVVLRAPTRQALHSNKQTLDFF